MKTTKEMILQHTCDGTIWIDTDAYFAQKLLLQMLVELKKIEMENPKGTFETKDLVNLIPTPYPYNITKFRFVNRTIIDEVVI
jgi:hypothetical protein